jgi:hypothetical protein
MTACLVSSGGSHDVEQIAWSPTKRKDPVSALASDPSGGRWDTLGMAGHGVRSGGIARTEIDAWTAAADRREEHSDVTHRVQTTVFDHADGYRRLSTRATTAGRRPRPPMASCGSYRRPASVSSTRVVSRFSTTCGIPVRATLTSARPSSRAARHLPFFEFFKKRSPTRRNTREPGESPLPWPEQTT